jgi:hypothetical protein
MPDAGASVESISTVFAYFNPTKSPYYTIGLASCVGLFYACDVPTTVANDTLWRWLALPGFIVLALSLALSLDSRNTLTNEEHADQLRFARSACISVAVLSLAFAGRAIGISMAPSTNQNAPCKVLASTQWHDFMFNVLICCIQVTLFLFYSWALNKEDLPPVLADRNYVQITLLTSAFLGDTSANLAYAADPTDQGCFHHQSTAYALGGLWVCCILFWLIKLVRLRVIQFTRPKPLAPTTGAGPSVQHQV